MEIKIPAHIRQLGIRDYHKLVALETIEDFENPKISEVIYVNALFSGMGEDYLRLCDVKSNMAVFRAICKMIDTHHPKPPAPEVTFDGTTYELVKDFTKLPTGWFVDLDAAHHKYTLDVPDDAPIAKRGVKVIAQETNRIEEEPELMAAFCYIEKGMDYAQMDKNKNILNPLQERADVFREHFHLGHFLDLTGFFLNVYNEWMKRSTPKERTKMEIEQMKGRLKSLSGRLSSMKWQKNSGPTGTTS